MVRINRHLFDEASKYIAGGVNSPVRSFKEVGGVPIFVKKGLGSKIYDVRGKEYIDYCLSWGALILGHSHPYVLREVKKTIENGTSFGMPTKLETELAKVICQAIPSIERLRLVNSGTEACMSAIRLARAFTKRDKIIKFKQCYHGHSDYFLVGKSLGIPKSLEKDTILIDYNDLDIVKKIFKKQARKIACIIVEPLGGNFGVVLPNRGFLEGLRDFCKRYESLLIFDEVITGFRFCFGGMQDIFKIKPDLTCLGKIIGGGFPLAAFGGRKEIMHLLAPEGGVYQAGTLAGNPVAVSAGIVTLKILSEENPYRELEEKVKSLTLVMENKAREYGIKLSLKRFGSMFSFHFNKEDYFKKFFHALLKKGVYLSPSPNEVCFLSTKHSWQDIEKTERAVELAFKN